MPASALTNAQMKMVQSFVRDLGGGFVMIGGDQSFGPGGAQMLTTDVDGDGDADVVTSLAAHGSGLAWYEQTSAGAFTEHVIVPLDGGTLNLHEPHAVALADMRMTAPIRYTGTITRIPPRSP